MRRPTGPPSARAVALLAWRVQRVAAQALVREAAEAGSYQLVGLAVAAVARATARETVASAAREAVGQEVVVRARVAMAKGVAAAAGAATTVVAARAVDWVEAVMAKGVAVG